MGGRLIPDAELELWAGGEGEGAWNMRYPDRLALTLDSASYKAGETAKVMVRAPFSGKLILSVERDQVLWSETFDLEGNTGTFSIPVLVARAC